MKGGGMIKWLVMAAGAYLLWRSGIFAKLGLSFLPAPPTAAALPAATSAATSTSVTGGGLPTAVPAPSTMPVSSIPTGGGGAVSASPVPPPAAYTPAQIDEMTKRAAAGDMQAAAVLTGLGVVYNGHQWNWFREQAGNPPAPATEGLDNVMTATQYLAYRLQLGLGGVVSLAGMPVGVIQ